MCVCVCVCVFSLSTWNDNREGSRMPLVTVVPLDSTFENELRKILYYCSYTFNPFIISCSCTIKIIIIIIMTRIIVYINFLLLQSVLSANILRNSAGNCLLVLWSFKICLFEPFKGRLCCMRN